MSADNWRSCPACLAAAEKARQECVAKAEKSYGKVSSEKYLALLEKARTPTAELRETLREDYECYVDDEGTFTVSYSCSCQKCPFQFEYKHTQDVPLDVKEKP